MMVVLSMRRRILQLVTFLAKHCRPKNAAFILRLLIPWFLSSDDYKPCIKSRMQWASQPFKEASEKTSDRKSKFLMRCSHLFDFSTTSSLTDWEIVIGLFRTLRSRCKDVRILWRQQRILICQSILWIREKWTIFYFKIVYLPGESDPFFIC